MKTSTPIVILLVCLLNSISLALAQSISIPREGLVGWWRGQGNAQDSAGNHDGVLPFGMHYAQGPNGLAFDFDGTSQDRVCIPDSPDFQLTNELTIEGWIYPRQSSGYIFFYGDDRAGLDPYKIDLPDGCVRFQITDAANQTVGIQAPIQFNHWQHIAATFGEYGQMQLFINGELVAATNTTLVPLDHLDPGWRPGIGIGNTQGTQYPTPFNGMISDIALYSRALTASEIRSIYENGNAEHAKAWTLNSGDQPRHAKAWTPNPASDGLTINQIHYDGVLSTNQACWTLDIDAVASKKGESYTPLLDGDLAVLPVELPDSVKIVREGTLYTLVASRPGKFKMKLGFVTKTDLDGRWSSTSFTGPAATIGSVTAQADGADTEIQLLDGTTLGVAKTNGASCLTGYLGADQTVSLRWRPKMVVATHKALLIVDSTLAAQVTPAVIKYTSAFHYNIVQGATTELELALPDQTLTHLEGDGIRDWRISEGRGGDSLSPQTSERGDKLSPPRGQILTVEFIKPLENDYDLTVYTEQSVDGSAGRPILEPPQPLDVDHESGSLVISAENTLVDIAAPAELRQVNAPDNAIAAYEFDARPLTLGLKLAPIEPEINVTDRVNAQLEETRLVVLHHLSLDVEKAGIYALELTPQPGFVVADVRGDGIEDWNVSNGKIHVDFSDRVLGSARIDVQLEQALKQFPDKISIAPLDVAGAEDQKAQIGAAAAPGLRLRTGALAGVREIPVDRLPDHSDESLAYTANGTGWNLSIATERLAPHVVADVFNLVTIGDGITGGSATIRYGLANQGVQEFRVRVPANFKNVEFTGPNIRSKEFTNNVWTIGLQDKVWGGYTLVVTYDYQFDSSGATLPIAGIHALDVERETGSIAVTSAANLQINPSSISDSLQRIDESELSAADHSLITRAVLLAFQYTGEQYDLALQVNHLPEVSVLEAVADRTQITSVLTDSGEMLTQASFMVKNNEKQFQRFELPANANLWGCYVNGQPAKPESNGPWILVPLPRAADRDQAFAVDIVYAQTNGALASTLGKSLDLDAPRTDVPNTYAEWRLFAPAGFRLSSFGGSMNVAEGTTYGMFDAWEKFLSFYGDVLRAAGPTMFAFGLLAFLVIAFVISAVRRGWSGVITLFVVVMIFSVLAAMLLPVLGAAKRRAQRINSVSNLKQIGLAARIFAGDNNNRLPYSFEEMSNELGTDKITYDVETGERFTYLGNGMSEDALQPDSVLAYGPIVNGGCNILFADGSVEEITAEKFQELSQRGLVQMAGPNGTSVAQNQAITASSTVPVEAPPAGGAGGGGVYSANVAGTSGQSSPPAAVAGVRSIRIELPQTGQPFLFTKIMNISDEPLSIHARIMPLSVFETFQMLWQTAAFLAGLFIWWLQWRGERRNSFVLTVAIALIIGSVCSLLVQWRALHDALIIGFPLTALGIIVLLIWKYWPRHGGTRQATEPTVPDPSPVLATGAPPVAAAIVLLAALGLTAANAQDTHSLTVGALSANFINSATYFGFVNHRVAMVDATFEFSPDQSGVSVPLLGDDVAVQQFTVKNGKAELVRNGEMLFVKLESRDAVKVQIHMLVKVTGDVTSHRLNFNIPPALSSQAAFVLDEPEADVEFPAAVSFTRILEKDRTRVEAVMGSSGEIDLSWTPRVKQAGEVAATVFCQNATLVTFGGGVMNVSAGLDYQITQGELRQARVQLPAGQRLLRVEAPQIRTWQITNDNGAQILVVDLLEGVTQSWHLTLELEKNLDTLPADMAVAVPHASGVQRETGFIALRGNDQLALSVETVSGLDRVDTAQFPGDNHGLQSAFEFSRPDCGLQVHLAAIQPQIEATAMNHFRVGAGQVSLLATIDYTIKRAGIFALEVALPDGYHVENVEGDNIQQQYERNENGSRLLEVTLKSRATGNYRLGLELTRDLKELPKSLGIAGVQPLGVERLTGFIAVSAEPGVALKTESFDGLIEIPAVSLPDRSTAAEDGSVLAYKFISSGPQAAPQWSLNLTTETVNAWVRAEIVDTISLADTLVTGRALVRYDIANAPVKELSVKVPANVQNVEISGPNIRSREQDGDVWRVELQSPAQGSYTLTVTWEQPCPSDTNAMNVAGVSAQNVERETGMLAITARAPMQVAESSAENIQRADTSDFPDWAGNPDPAAALVYRYVRPGYKLSLDVRRLNAATVLQAIVQDAQLTSVVADDGQMMTEMSLSLQSNGRQFLAIDLPSGSTVWSAFVAGQAVRPGVLDGKLGGGKLLIPIEQSAADDGVIPVELTYVGTNSFPRGDGPVHFDSPKFDVPLKNARWQVYLPPDYDYSRFQGTMTREMASAPESASKSFSSLDYSLMEQTSKSADTQEALQDIDEARRQLQQGDVRGAGVNVYRAKIQLAKDNANSAEVNQLESDLQRAQANNLINAQSDFTANNSWQTPMGFGGTSQAGQSGAQYDFASAGEQWAKLEQAQEIATARIQPLHVNLPVRGLRFAFTQVLQTETGEPMTIQLFAANAKAVHWPARLLKLACAFLALWAMVAIFCHYTTRARTA
ncbi:MAG TPA: LamG-like jellyroll fold domain-containing protein [Candidatus Sulfotelmatobacter sp.]|nr:LamG-like jellyroll fold domain-containing protein [Candidatus Sulfotelmatobacter sp.]